MAQANLSTTATVPQNNSGPDMTALVVVLVLILIVVCSCGALYGHYRIRRWQDNRRKYKDYYNNNGRPRDDDEPDERNYRRNDRRGDARQTSSHRDQDGNRHHYYFYHAPPPAPHGNAPHAQAKDHAPEKQTQTSAHHEEQGHHAQTSAHHEEQGHHAQAPAHHEDHAHSVRSDGARSSSRVIHRTDPVEVPSWHIPNFHVQPPPQPYQPQSRSSSYTSTIPTIWPHTSHSGQHPFGAHSMPTPTLPHFPNTFGAHSMPTPTLPHFPRPPHLPPAPHLLHPSHLPQAPHLWRTHSKIGTEDPDDSP